MSLCTSSPVFALPGSSRAGFELVPWYTTKKTIGIRIQNLAGKEKQGLDFSHICKDDDSIQPNINLTSFPGGCPPDQSHSLPTCRNGSVLSYAPNGDVRRQAGRPNQMHILFFFSNTRICSAQPKCLLKLVSIVSQRHASKETCTYTAYSSAHPPAGCRTKQIRKTAQLFRFGLARLGPGSLPKFQSTFCWLAMSVWEGKSWL
ncbi:uncharacterized protein BDZ83DRAFT_606928 [Colletotrichum acutatum]|uniref:Uncharacterized protein n=1 Tax=Glomerella acutata TaxID=27357 RepID=A0AAD8XKR9_GLOAC|nr:uncharacterized protein BDZ83DRAFT_606928 [Colletotrichum acutatum]KAK1729153.1 hypothetical protein BDZ83DRAFT_606928 [Colletotrichum acutatum]